MAGVACSVSAVYPSLRRLGITRKKGRSGRPSRIDPISIVERTAWREEFAATDPSMLVFVDESGACTAMDQHAWPGPRRGAGGRAGAARGLP